MLKQTTSCSPSRSTMQVTLELGADLQLEYQSWLDVKESLGIERSINNFLYYTYNYGTFANPRNPDDNEPGTE
jgi:hypothetical protein